MPTKSILKTIRLETPADVRRFMDALHEAENTDSEDIKLPYQVSVATKDEIRSMFQQK